MPLNEAQIPRWSGLSERQRQEAMRAIYGETEMSPNELTFEERVKMRRMLDALDQKEAGGMKEFDLNKPPVKPYVYSEYPFLMYQDGRTRSARNREEREQMLASGWREDPAPAEDKAEVTDNRKRR